VCLRRVCALVGVLVWAAAPAQARRWRGGGSLAIEARGQHADELDVGMFGVTARGLGGKGPLMLAGGMSWQLGASLPAGFLYELDVSPIGIGLLGHTARIAVTGGAGFSAIAGQVPFAGVFPVEAYAEVNLGDRVRLGASARAAFVVGAEERKDGAPDAPFGDEAQAGLWLRLDTRTEEFGVDGGDGYHLGALVGQRMGVTFFGAAFGFSLDAAVDEKRF
jgi:hypothetical protein